MDIEVIEHQETRTDLMPMYKVLVHDDNVNTMDFVVHVFQDVFKYELEKCIAHMLEVHNSGISLLKVEPLEHAELHYDQLHSYGLTSSIEPE
jgi:ATP-dependent Clp protease adaptor protein ClpS